MPAAIGTNGTCLWYRQEGGSCGCPPCFGDLVGRKLMNWESVSCLSQMGNGLEYILSSQSWLRGLVWSTMVALGYICKSYPKHQKVLLIQRRGKLSQTLWFGENLSHSPNKLSHNFPIMGTPAYHLTGGSTFCSFENLPQRVLQLKSKRGEGSDDIISLWVTLRLQRAYLVNTIKNKMPGSMGI